MSVPPKPPAPEVRHLLLGAVFDFILHLVNRDPPIVVGKDYPRDKLIKEFEEWAGERGIVVDRIDIDSFRFLFKNRLI